MRKFENFLHVKIQQNFEHCQSFQLWSFKNIKIKYFECFRTESSDSARNPQESQILDGSQSSKTLKSKEFRHAQKLKFLTSEDLLK